MRGVDNGRQRFVFNGDQFGRVARHGGGLGHNHRDRVADMPHPLARNRRMRRQHRLRAVAIADRTDARDVSDPVTRQVFSGKDREHAGGSKRRGCIDAG